MSGSPTQMNRFSLMFKALTGYDPFPWQRRLYRRFMDADLPSTCTIPTGLGKTSVIPIWLIALATQATNGCPASLPRRLIYIVNRRTVVDQATVVAGHLSQQLSNESNGVIQELRDALCQLASVHADLPVAVSTLRGELADNEEWKADPARPAIIVGTIDMVGSKLLFSGYGDGRYGRAHHAGLIGQDALVVHDEAHLTPAFGRLLRGVAETQSHDGEPLAVRVMELSATSRGNDGDVLKLESEDEQDAVVNQRLDAAKRLRLHEVKRDGITDELVHLSTRHGKGRSRVLVYVRSPEDAQTVAKQIEGKRPGSPVALLTGTIRGHERDELARSNPVYRALLDHDIKVTQTVYLVSTSAGEVGIDLDADHMVCDMAPLDSMVQRLGRVNRRGGSGRVAQVEVVAEKKAKQAKKKAKQEDEEKTKDKASPFDKAIKATQAILKGWTDAAGGKLDVSPRNLRTLMEELSEDQEKHAFSPAPAVSPLTDILLDAWSLTSITAPMPGRPMVAAYLHGLTNDPPETYLAWRKEVTLLDEARVDGKSLSAWFGACRIEARERLRDRTDRVGKALGALLKTHRQKNRDSDFSAVLLNERGEAEWSNLSRIAEEDSGLAYRTVVLPVEAGGLSADGTLDAKFMEPARDVADTSGADLPGDRRERWLHIRDEGGERYECLLAGGTADSLPQGLRERVRITLQQAPEGGEEGGESKYLLLMTRSKHTAQDDPESVRAERLLDDHTREVVECVKRIAESLGLGRSLKHALCQAATWHDRGKDRRIWQHFAGNPDPARPLAKGRKFLPGRVLGGYRHEFGSLLEAAKSNEVPEDVEADLVLHLVAAHHGWARPHFEPGAFDHQEFSTADNQEAVAEAMRRFGRLQQRFGRWGLAWLESLLRCADIAASRQAAEAPTASPVEEVST